MIVVVCPNYRSFLFVETFRERTITVYIGKRRFLAKQCENNPCDTDELKRSQLETAVRSKNVFVPLVA